MLLTVVGPDRPGLVRDISETINAHGGSWVDSSLARLGGAFAGIVRVSLSEESAEPLRAALSALGATGLVVTQVEAEERLVDGRRAHLSLSCVDRHGIVRDLAEALSRNGAIFETLETSLDHGSMSGELMFSAEAIVWMPERLTPEALAKACEALNPDLVADVDLID